MNQTSKRRKLVFGANTAHTPEEIRHVKDAVDAWLRRHPEDEAIRRASRQLERAEDRLREAVGWR